MLKLCMIIVHDPIIHDLLGLQTKGKLACPVCGSKMKSCHSRSLGKQCLMSLDTFSTIIIGIELPKTSFQWERGDIIKATKNDTSFMEVGIRSTKSLR